MEGDPFAPRRGEKIRKARLRGVLGQSCPSSGLSATFSPQAGRRKEPKGLGIIFQRPLNTGGRFSRKPATPSLRSSVVDTSAPARISSVARGSSSSAALMSCLATVVATGPRAAIAPRPGPRRVETAALRRDLVEQAQRKGSVGGNDLAGQRQAAHHLAAEAASPAAACRTSPAPCRCRSRAGRISRPLRRCGNRRSRRVPARRRARGRSAPRSAGPSGAPAHRRRGGPAGPSPAPWREASRPPQALMSPPAQNALPWPVRIAARTDGSASIGSCRRQQAGDHRFVESIELVGLALG